MFKQNLKMRKIGHEKTEFKVLRQRSPQLVQIRFLRFRARESPCMAHKRQKRCLQLIPDVFMHRQLAQLRLSSEKEQFCHHFDVSPY